MTSVFWLTRTPPAPYNPAHIEGLDNTMILYVFLGGIG